MEFDFSKLKGRIVEKYGSRAAFASVVNMTSEQLSRRLNNRTQFSPEEIVMIAETLDISPTDFYDYFFTPKVR